MSDVMNSNMDLLRDDAGVNLAHNNTITHYILVTKHTCLLTVTPIARVHIEHNTSATMVIFERKSLVNRGIHLNINVVTMLHNNRITKAFAAVVWCVP